MLYSNIISQRYKHADSAVTPSGSNTCSKQMSITIDGFARQLPQAVAGAVKKIGHGGAMFLVRDGRRSVHITCSPRADRVIGSLRLPVLDVTIGSYGYTTAEWGRFMDRFDRSFLRMGG